MAEKVEIMQHESLAEALLRAQMEYPPLDKGSTVEVKKEGRLLYTYKYADLAYTKRMTDPYLWKHGLVVNGKTEYRDGKEFQVDVLRHAHSKEEDRSEIEVTESDMKLFGGNSTYAKRYNYCNLTGRVGEDDSESRPLDNRRQASGSKEDPLSAVMASIQRGEEELSKKLKCSEADLRNDHFGADNDVLEAKTLEELEGYLGKLRSLRDTGEQERPAGDTGASTEDVPRLKSQASQLQAKVLHQNLVPKLDVDAKRRELFGKLSYPEDADLLTQYITWMNEAIGNEGSVPDST